VSARLRSRQRLSIGSLHIVPRIHEIHVDGTVLAFAFGLSVVTDFPLAFSRRCASRGRA
jgi:hypothetical protein